MKRQNDFIPMAFYIRRINRYDRSLTTFKLLK